MMNALTFLNPMFLWALPTAALPLLFHLFFRVRKRLRPFPTFMFFIAIDPMLNARRRVREWLVLILRTLALIFIVLALAGPVRTGIASGNGGVARVLVLDNSGSMGAPDANGRRRWDVTIEAASALIKALRPADAAGMVTLVRDSGAVLPEGMISNQEILEAALASLSPTEATGHPALALTQAVALLQDHSSPGGEIHVFTDLQEAEWAGNASTPVTLPSCVTLWIHRIEQATPDPANVSLMSVMGPGRALTDGEPFAIEVELLNRSQSAMEMNVIGVDDKGVNELQRLALKPGESRTARLPFKAGPEGTHGINVRIEGDDFEADNRAGVGISSVAARRVLLVGDRTAHGFLPFALAPSDSSGLAVESVPASDLATRLESSNIACVAVTMPGIEAIDATTLRRYVEQGGILIVACSALVKNLQGMKRLPDWLGINIEPIVADTNGLPVRALAPDSELFRDMRNDRNEVILGAVRAFRAHPLSLQPGTALLATRALLSLDDGRVLFYTGELGSGRVFISGLAFTPDWSTFPLRAGFVVFMRAIALAGGAKNPGASLVAGQHWQPPGDWTQAMFRVNSICGPKMKWEGPVRDGFAPARAGVFSAILTELPEHGAANASQSALPEIPLSVRASEAEGVWRFVKGGSVPTLRGVTHTVTQYRDSSALLTEIRAREATRSLRHVAIFLTLAALLAEALAANPRGRRKKLKADG